VPRNRFLLITLCAPVVFRALAADKKVPAVFPGGEPAITLKDAVKGSDGVEYLGG
jgi:hypothetical protein